MVLHGYGRGVFQFDATIGTVKERCESWFSVSRQGSLPGTVLAAVLIGLSDGIISVFFTPTLAKILATLLVAFVLVFRPQGLFGKRHA